MFASHNSICSKFSARYYACISLALLFLAACARPEQMDFRSGLEGKGPVALSDSNPFVATNLFLEAEARRDAVLAGFLKHSGRPEAIELTRSEDGVLSAYFYYYKKNKRFLLEEHEGHWVAFPAEEILELEPSKKAVIAPRKEKPEDKAAATTSIKSDLLYDVVSPGITVEQIAQTTTGDKAHARAIARINNVSPTEDLQPGTTIVVPSYLLK